MNSVARLRLLSRPDCGLCDEFQAELAQLAQSTQLPPMETIDVDSDPQLARRYGLDIPVLLLDGVRVCQHRLDAGELLRLLRPR
ncbi:MAG: glutaredoxin family protein [Pseudomonadota bacterium]